MRIVIAVDWSEETFAAVQAVGRMYRPSEVALIHAVDVTPFESPMLSPHIAKEAYAELRGALVDSGEQLLEQTAALVPSGGASIRRLCELGGPAEVILETAVATAADLLVLGTRRRGRLAELLLGSVSHRVLLHASCPILLVKRPLTALERVLVAVEGRDDVEQIRTWLLTHPFITPVDLTVLHVRPSLHVDGPAAELSHIDWARHAEETGRRVVDDLTASLTGPSTSITTRVIAGHPAEAIVDASQDCDLLVVGSHGRTGLSRFLMGSVSHAVTHRVACPILVIRK